MKKLAAMMVMLVLLLPPGSLLAGEATPGERSGKSFGHRLLFYIPNRIFDVFDVARARVRVGPGFAVDARVTKYGDLYAGAYSTLFVGVHGPRTQPNIPWPVGLEARAGIKATSVANAATQGPRYGYGEVGAGFQAAILGIDLGVDVVEVLDLVLGFFFIDLTGDDF
ncbi:MAG TPA: hypothetical protein VMV04_01030 [Thermodesulfobacteriota bacterium]|nr:hypothetical protein [Thermodesulfobacteriota bacterium]